MAKSESSHNPYFNRWFSAIKEKDNGEFAKIGHNPYFNRWFSAISTSFVIGVQVHPSQSLF